MHNDSPRTIVRLDGHNAQSRARQLSLRITVILETINRDGANRDEYVNATAKVACTPAQFGQRATHAASAFPAPELLCMIC